jgi:hypothetical protein
VRGAFGCVVCGVLCVGWCLGACPFFFWFLYLCVRCALCCVAWGGVVIRMVWFGLDWGFVRCAIRVVWCGVVAWVGFGWIGVGFCAWCVLRYA